MLLTPLNWAHFLFLCMYFFIFTTPFFLGFGFVYLNTMLISFYIKCFGDCGLLWGVGVQVAYTEQRKGRTQNRGRKQVAGTKRACGG
jgi:hypothetical protein